MEELYKKAIEKGYSGNKSLEEIQSWIRHTYFLHPEIYFSKFHKHWYVNNFFINVKKAKSLPFKDFVDIPLDTYEAALELALIKLLEIVKTK
jgi:hypothetical protein